VCVAPLARRSGCRATFGTPGRTSAADRAVPIDNIIGAGLRGAMSPCHRWGGESSGHVQEPAPNARATHSGEYKAFGHCVPAHLLGQLPADAQQAARFLVVTRQALEQLLGDLLGTRVSISRRSAAPIASASCNARGLRGLPM